MRPGGAQRRVDQHERLTTSEPPSIPPDTRMVEPQGILLRPRRLHPHTKPQPHGRRAQEAVDSQGPGADEPPVRDHSTRKRCSETPTRPREPEPTETQPHHSQASTEHKKPATRTTNTARDDETQASAPRETTPAAHASPGREIKVQGVPVPRVSEVRARRATHRVVGQGDGP